MRQSTTQARRPAAQAAVVARSGSTNAARLSLLRCAPPVASMSPTPGTSAEMEAVKKFSRSNVSIAAICVSSCCFMYLAQAWQRRWHGRPWATARVQATEQVPERRP